MIEWVLSHHYGPEYWNDSLGMVIMLCFIAVFRFGKREPMNLVSNLFVRFNSVYCVVTSVTCLYAGTINGDGDVMLWHTFNIFFGWGLLWWASEDSRARRELHSHPVYQITQLER